MSFNPSEMLQKIRLQNQIQGVQQYQQKHENGHYTSQNIQSSNNNQNNQLLNEQNYIPANHNIVQQQDKSKYNQKNQNDIRQSADPKHGMQRNSSKKQFNQQGEMYNSKGKVHIQISQEMIDNENKQNQEYKQKMNLTHPISELDQQLIENLVLKIQSLEGQVFNLTSNLNNANISVHDLLNKKKLLEEELSIQIAKQIEERQQKQEWNKNQQQNKVAAFGRVQEQKKQQQDGMNKSIISIQDDFQMHAISEQISEEDEDQRSKIAQNKKSRIIEEAIKSLEEESNQMRLQNSVKMESIQDILKKKGKSPLKIHDQNDTLSREDTQIMSYNQSFKQQQIYEAPIVKANPLNRNQDRIQQYQKENLNSTVKKRENQNSKSPLKQTQIQNKSQKFSRIQNSIEKEEEYLKSDKNSFKQKESRVNTSTTPTRSIEKPVGRLNLDLLSQLIKTNPCLNRPILNIKMDDNLFM